MKKLLIPAILLVSSNLASAQIISGYSENFNSGAGTLDDFRDTAGTTINWHAWNATIGTGGSGGFQVFTTGTNVFYRTASNTTLTSYGIDSAAAGSLISTSMDFRFNNTSTELTVLTNGFTTQNSGSAFSNTTANTNLAASIIRSNGGSTVTLRLRDDGANAATLNFNQSTLTNNAWYRLTFDLTKTATANVFDYTTTLWSIGATGTSTPTIFNDGTQDITLSGSVTNSGIYSGISQWGFDVRDTAGNTGITALDNFSVAVIPEPSSMALITVVLGALVILRRRALRV